jgi:hypothetical protein
MSCKRNKNQLLVIALKLCFASVYISWTQAKEFKVALWGDLVGYLFDHIGLHRTVSAITIISLRHFLPPISFILGKKPYHGSSDNIFDPDDPYGAIYGSFRDSVNDHVKNNDVQLAFHTGDIKSGGSPCVTLYYDRFADLANSLNVPTLLTIGDNEWTDCHRSGFNPIDRLQYVRDRFYNHVTSTASSNTVRNRLGGGDTISISHFGPYSRPYIENQYVIRDGIIFATLHVPGSNNNFRSGGCAASLNEVDKGCVMANAEYVARNHAVVSALRIVFSTAKSQKLKGIMFVIQAHFWGGTVEKCNSLRINVNNAEASVASGYKSFMKAFMEEVSQYHNIGDVVVVHGDAHFFRNCRPTVYNNVAFVMVPGSADVSWALATINSERSLSNVFSFQHIHRPFQPLPAPVPSAESSPIAQPIPVPTISTPVKGNNELCRLKYKLFNGKTDAYIMQIIPNEKIDDPPCDVNIEVVIRCLNNDGSQKRTIVKDKAIRMTLRRVIDMKVMYSRTAENGPYFLFGNNGTDIHSGIMAQSRFLLRIRSFDSSLNGMLPINGVQFFMGKCI